MKLERQKRESDNLKKEIISKNKNLEEFQEEFQKIIGENDEKLNEINNLKNELMIKNSQIEEYKKENVKFKNMVDSLKKEIIEKNKIMD